MMSSSNEKKKGPNFSAKEVESLITLVQKYRDGINCNKTDVKQQIRKDAWRKIAMQFNAHSDVYRSPEALKSKYKNMKATSARKFSDLRSYSRGTGGGPPKKPDITDVDEVMKELNTEQMDGLKSKYDDDYDDEDASYDVRDGLDVEDLNVDVGDDIILHVYEDEDGKDVSANSDTEISSHKENHPDHANWSKYTPQMLKSAKAPELQVITPTSRTKKQAEPLKTKLGKWAATKVELAELQKTTFLEQHNEKLKLMRAKHERELQLLVNESRERMQWVKEEHNMKIEILKAQKRKYSGSE